jgi:hypothetical protein
MKRALLLLGLLTTLSARAATPVIDVEVLKNVIKEVVLVTEQLNQLKIQVQRLGDPAAVEPTSARAVIRSLGLTGVGATLDDLQTLANGTGGVLYDGHGLYRPVGEAVTTADGRAFPRPVEDYRKYDAVTQARFAMEAVMTDTEQRRQAMRSQISDTTAQLRVAKTMAEVAKLQAVLAAQSAELGAIDRERDAALARVLAQRIENETDRERQEQARTEERIVDFRASSAKLSEFLTPNTAPVKIPDPRQTPR